MCMCVISHLGLIGFHPMAWFLITSFTPADSNDLLVTHAAAEAE